MYAFADLFSIGVDEVQISNGIEEREIKWIATGP